MPSKRKKAAERRRSPRGSGEPYYDKRRKKWISPYSRTVAGKRHRLEFVGSSPKEALAKFRAAMERGLRRDGPMDQRPLSDWQQSWIDECSLRLKPKTIDGYESTCNLHILPYIGTLRLHAIDAHVVANLLTALVKDGRGQRTIDKARSVLSAALEIAWRRGVIASNPVRLVSGTGYEPPERNTLSFDECVEMFKQIMYYRQGAVCILAATMGLRLGEILALDWDKIDLRRRELRVALELSYVKGEIHWVAPKTKRSRRSLAMPAVAIDALKVHRARMQREGHCITHGLVFLTREGNPQKPTGLARDMLRPALKRAGVRADVTIHDLRHSFATNMGRNGAPIHVVSEILGHSRRSTTLDIYTHAFSQDGKAAMAIVDRSLKLTLNDPLLDKPNRSRAQSKRIKHEAK